MASSRRSEFDPPRRKRPGWNDAYRNESGDGLVSDEEAQAIADALREEDRYDYYDD